MRAKGNVFSYGDNIDTCLLYTSRPSIGKDSFQEVDIYGVSMPVTKHNYMVKDVHALADTLRLSLIHIFRRGLLFPLFLPPYVPGALLPASSALRAYAAVRRGLLFPRFLLPYMPGALPPVSPGSDAYAACLLYTSHHMFR